MVWHVMQHHHFLDGAVVVAEVLALPLAMGPRIVALLLPLWSGGGRRGLGLDPHGGTTQGANVHLLDNAVMAVVHFCSLRWYRARCGFSISLTGRWRLGSWPCPLQLHGALWCCQPAYHGSRGGGSRSRGLRWGVFCLQFCYIFILQL